ncbi:VC0807 family protein [Paraburkholderia sp. B3]|uniref:VC0807 family protein n=1 Tax=Paraburkholderia sp. B3 TaxID=3134791 RepID=UPI003982BFB6
MMNPSARYVLAFVVNVALPVAAYWMAIGTYGLRGALIASSLPVLVWMTIDLVRFRHFDALSAIVLAGIALSLLVLLSGPPRWLREARDPLVNGMIGLLFLLSLAFKRPLVFYLGRSTLSRQRAGRENEFDEMWQTHPTLVKSIRLMTAVWGIGLVSENIIRLWISSYMTNPQADRLSTIIRYTVYTGLTAWTIFYRRVYLKRQVAPTPAETAGTGHA